MKKIISVMLAVLLAAAMALPALALGGKVGSLSWDLRDGVLTLSGGDIPDFSASAAAPWLKFADDVKSVIVGDGVTRIGDRAFEDMTSLEKVDMGGATAVGKMAFSGCTSLTNVTFPDSVTSVGDFALAECVALKKTVLPAGLCEIGEGVWEGCHALTEISGGSEKLYTKSGILYSADGAILRYPSARFGVSFTLPGGITAVGTGAFRDCTKLTSVKLGDVEIIGDGAFYGCTALSAVDLLGVKTVGRAAFYGCVSVSEVTFGAGLTGIGDEAFAHCSNLSVAEFTGDAPSANEGIFYGCGVNFTVVIGEGCDGFGDGSTWLGYTLVRHGLYKGVIEGITWELDTATGVMTLSGEGELPDFDYASDAPWYEYRKLIRSLSVDGVSAIGANAFRYSGLEEIVFPESVTKIGAYAFSGCSSLESAEILGACEIRECAFFGDVVLMDVRALSVTYIGDQAFSGCVGLKYVFTGKDAPTLGKYVFDGTDAALLFPKGGAGYSGGEWDNVYTEQYVAGDANGDGKANISDASAMLKRIAGWDISVLRVGPDVNLDGKVNITDVSILLKYIAGWDITIGW